MIMWHVTLITYVSLCTDMVFMRVVFKSFLGLLEMLNVGCRWSNFSSDLFLTSDVQTYSDSIATDDVMPC